MKNTKIPIVHLRNTNNQIIHTDLTDEIRSIISSEGFEPFEALQGPIELSEIGWNEVNNLISP